MTTDNKAVIQALVAYPIVLPQHKTTSILPQIFLSEAVQLVPEQLSKQLHQQSEQQVDN